MTILWDRSQIHDRSKVVRAYLAEHPEIVTEKLPATPPRPIPTRRCGSTPSTAGWRISPPRTRRSCAGR